MANKRGNESFIGHLEYTLNKTNLVTVETTAASDGGERSEADGKAKAKQKGRKTGEHGGRQSVCKLNKIINDIECHK